MLITLQPRPFSCFTLILEWKKNGFLKSLEDLKSSGTKTVLNGVVVRDDTRSLKCIFTANFFRMPVHYLCRIQGTHRKSFWS